MVNQKFNIPTHSPSFPRRRESRLKIAPFLLSFSLRPYAFNLFKNSMLGVRCSMFIFLLLLTLSCAKQIPEQRFTVEKAEFSLLITGMTSEFKADIISRIVDRYKDKGNIYLIPLDKLDQMQCVDYDAILVIDSVQAWSYWNFSLNSFLENTENCKNVVLLYTAGDPDWEYQYHELDAITSASQIEDQDRVFNELTYAIDVLISRI